MGMGLAGIVFRSDVRQVSGIRAHSLYAELESIAPPKSDQGEREQPSDFVSNTAFSHLPSISIPEWISISPLSLRERFTDEDWTAPRINGSTGPSGAYPMDHTMKGPLTVHTKYERTSPP